MPLWVGGTLVPAASLLTPGLADRLDRWNAAYTEEKVPLTGSGDEMWLDEGRQLLAKVRSEHWRSHHVVADEPWWQ